MPRLLKDLQINDVSSVDRGAGEGVKVMLLKRDAPKVETLDMTGLLKTVAAVSKDAIDFDAANDLQESSEAANGLMDELNEAICALSCAVNSIMCDESVADKAGAVAESFDQFKTHLEGLTPESLEKAMTPEIKKAIDDAVGAVVAPLKDQIGKLQAENAVLKMTDPHQAFHSKLDGNEKTKFGAMSHDERNAYMEAHPQADAEGAKEDAGDTTEKALKAAPLDPIIAKRLAEADEDRKILKSLQEKDEKNTFAKRAAELGLHEDMGEFLRKAHKGDANALAAIETKLGELSKALRAAQDTSGIFKEFGNSQGGSGATAMDQLTAKAEEYRKTADGSKLSPQQAFAKVYEDPANENLVKQEKAERNRKLGVSA